MCHRHYRAFCIVVVAAGVADFVVVDSVVVVVPVMFLLARFLCLFLCLRVRFAPKWVYPLWYLVLKAFAKQIWN